MARDRVQLVYFFSLLFVAAALTAFVFLPYMPAILAAAVLAIVFMPVHRRFLYLAGNRPFAASLLSTAFVLVVIIIPLSVFSALLFEELGRIYTHVSTTSFLGDTLVALSEWVGSFVPAAGEYIRTTVVEFNPDRYIEQLLGWAFQATNTVFTQTVHLVFGGAISLLALFYLFKDGNRAVAYVMKVSPLAPGYERTILTKIESAINSVIRGRVLAGIIQGILTGVAFAVVGIPAPVLWAGVATILSIIPILGPGLVITPAVIYLFAIGNVWSAALLLVWAMIAIYFVDDIISPLIIERGMHIHPFLILVSILGGISFLGPVGFIAGPVILALFVVLLELYPTVLSHKTNARSRRKPSL